MRRPVHISWEGSHLLLLPTFSFHVLPIRFRFAEFRYLREGSPSHQEQTVVFLPDIWTCMPSLEEWEALCKQKAEKAPPLTPEVKVELVSDGCNEREG